MALERTFSLKETDNPNERALWTYHDMEKLAFISDMGDNGWPINEVTLYKDWFLKEPNLSQRPNGSLLYGNYVYKACRIDGGVIALFWVKKKTNEERNTPYETGSFTERVPWGAELDWIQFGQESGFPLSQTTINGSGVESKVIASRWLVPRGYRNAHTIQTVIDFKDFLSDSPWGEYFSESDEPRLTEVMWDLVGSHGSTGPCYHDEVIVPAQATAGYRVISSAGSVSAGNSTNPKQWVFPKTNHKQRRDYVVNVITLKDYQYQRRELTFRVPRRDKLVKLS